MNIYAPERARFSVKSYKLTTKKTPSTVLGEGRLGVKVLNR